ncbi:MAG: hypothetical protein JEZ12_21365 [Desulfobacterium sp.]|nr:hypothetical protein [Desulfobacterium sp.]
MEILNDAELKGIHAQSGISVVVDHVPVYYKADYYKFTAVDNKDLFGTSTPYQGSAALDSFESFAEMNGEFHMDIGTYMAPDEHLLASDIGKKDGIGDNKYEHWYVGWRLPGSIHTLQEDPYYWPIGDDIPRPLDNKVQVLQVSMSNLTSSFYSRSTIKFCDLNLSNMGVSGMTMPEFIHDGESLPGTALTLFPERISGISAEIRTRLTIDEFKLHGEGKASNPDFEVTGIHLGEAFNQVLPNHVADTGDPLGPGIDTSGWGSDIKHHMHRGYFLLGNLNQVDYADNINEQELVSHLGNTNNDQDGSLDPVGLVANPLSLNFATVDGRSFISLNTGIDGSIRIESSKGWEGSDFGPIAVDGIKIKHCEIEFPGGYTRSDGSLKGQIHPAQLDWLNNL